MTDHVAEDKPEPPPRQLEWVRFQGQARAFQGDVEVEVRVAATSAFDPYQADTLHVSTASPLGPDWRRYLSRHGGWEDERLGVMVGDEGFEMPAGFSQALQNAFQGELRKAKQEAVDALEAADAIVETYRKVADLTTTAAESAVKRVEQLEAQVEALMAELDGWRNGDIVRGGADR